MGTTPWRVNEGQATPFVKQQVRSREVGESSLPLPRGIPEGVDAIVVSEWHSGVQAKRGNGVFMSSDAPRCMHDKQCAPEVDEITTAANQKREKPERFEGVNFHSPTICLPARSLASSLSLSLSVEFRLGVRACVRR